MPGRSYTGSTGYKYGYGGQEKINEVYNVEGSYLDYEFRGYNSRLGRFMAVDPLYKKYPELTPYQFASNTPIWASELEGLEANYSNGKAEEPFGGETIEAGKRTDKAGPLSDSYSQELNVVPGDTKGSAVGLNSSVDVFTGRAGNLGGKLGGHAVINLGADGAYSFSNDSKKDEGASPDATEGNHIFPHGPETANSIFKNYSPSDYSSLKFTKGKESVSFGVDFTLEQRESIMEEYRGKPSVDYAVFGFRCASYCLKTLSSLDIVNSTAPKFNAPTPAALIKYLESKLGGGKTNAGDPNVNFNNPLKK